MNRDLKFYYETKIKNLEDPKGVPQIDMKALEALIRVFGEERVGELTVADVDEIRANAFNAVWSLAVPQADANYTFSEAFEDWVITAGGFTLEGRGISCAGIDFVRF